MLCHLLSHVLSHVVSRCAAGADAEPKEQTVPSEPNTRPKPEVEGPEVEGPEVEGTEVEGTEGRIAVGPGI